MVSPWRVQKSNVLDFLYEMRKKTNNVSDFIGTLSISFSAENYIRFGFGQIRGRANFTLILYTEQIQAEIRSFSAVNRLSYTGFQEDELQNRLENNYEFINRLNNPMV